MMPLDIIDRVVSWPLGLSRELPPNRMRIRVGVGNRILFNQVHHVRLPVGFWMAALARGAVTMDARILDLGCGCGRYAAAMRDLDHYGCRFEGHYTGVDIDESMIKWCRDHFPAQRFSFEVVPGASSVYRPGGSEAGSSALPAADSDTDFVFANSLLTHLLEDDVGRILREANRVLRPGGEMQMTVFCLDHLSGQLGGRWTFRHRRGAAAIESERYPEAAVAYHAAFLHEACEQAGLRSIEIIPGGQSLLRARKPG